MAYDPEWERLAEALDRVMAASGLPSQEAQDDICRAIADRKIRVRPREAEPITRLIVDHQLNHRLAREYQGFVRRLLDGAIDMPWRLKPSDLDWNESRLAWLFQPGVEGYPGPPREWRVWIELFSADVTNALISTRLPQGIEKTKLEKGKSGRPAVYNWVGVKARLADYISQNGSVQTLNELLQKCADFANELHPKNSTPSDKTIREAIKKHNLDVVAGLSSGNG